MLTRDFEAFNLTNGRALPRAIMASLYRTVRESEMVTLFMTSLWLAVCLQYFIPMVLLLPLALVPVVGTNLCVVCVLMVGACVGRLAQNFRPRWLCAHVWRYRVACWNWPCLWTCASTRSVLPSLPPLLTHSRAPTRTLTASYCLFE